MSVYDDLVETKRILQVHGRCMGALKGSDGSYCLDGAIVEACGGGDFLTGGTYHSVEAYNFLSNDPRASAAVRALAKKIGSEFKWHAGVLSDSCENRDAVWRFNDAPLTTNAEVFRVLDAAIEDSRDTI